MLTCELRGAVIGSGLASGREIASFFTQYGKWSRMGIATACIMLVYLSNTSIPHNWKGKWQGAIFDVLMNFMLIVTGGAMMAGAGEIVQLLIPIHGAYWCGLITTYIVARILACQIHHGLAWVARILILVLVALIGMGLRVPEKSAVVISAGNCAEAIWRGVTYAGFNGALQYKILCKADVYSKQVQVKSLRRAGVGLAILLLLGDMVLKRHAALISEVMPFLSLMNSWGKPGYFLAAICMYMAVLSTLTACIRGIGGSGFAMAGFFCVAMVGFDGTIESLYPFLGALTMIYLLTAKIANCYQRTFQENVDMI